MGGGVIRIGVASTTFRTVYNNILNCYTRINNNFGPPCECIITRFSILKRDKIIIIKTKNVCVADIDDKAHKRL